MVLRSVGIDHSKKQGARTFGHNFGWLALATLKWEILSVTLSIVVKIWPVLDSW